MSRRGELIFHMADSPEDANQVCRPEIDRADLNHILYESLANSTIHWDHKLLSVQHVGEEYELQFANGETVKADLVVGADGAWSRVRPLVTSEKPKYSGVTFLSWSIEDFGKRFPELADLVGRGSLFCFGQGKMLTTQRNGYGVLRLYLGFEMAEDWDKMSPIALSSSDEERAKMLVESHYKDWEEKLHQIILAAGRPLEGEPASSESKMMAKGLYALPTGIQWPHRRGVTLIGDAAHVMSPCAGEGVNMAMMGALELAEAIASPLTQSGSHASFKDAAFDAVAGYEAKMFARLEEPMRSAAFNLNL